jgi:hypothetical protein
MLRLGPWRIDVEQLADKREVVGLHGTRQQTVVADAIKARWTWIRKRRMNSCGSSVMVL